MELFNYLILSLVEGVTEFLPVSSTGHLILASKLLSIHQTNFVKTFEIAIQSGAILSVVFLYRKILFKKLDILKKLFIAFVPTVIVGFVLYGFIKEFLIGNLMITILALIIGGFFLILIEKYFEKKEGKLKILELNTKQLLSIGIAQSVSVIPGVSRAAATIIGGMVTGLSRKEATEFSFLLAIPTMFAATGYDLLKNINSFDSSQITTLSIGFIASFFTAILAVKWFIKYIARNTLVPFGIYRIVVGIIFFLLFYL